MASLGGKSSVTEIARSSSSSSSSSAAQQAKRAFHDLPSVVFELMASFLPFQDRLSLSEQCRNARDGVENHSEKLLQKIVESQDVDNTFQSRIRDLSNIVTTQENPELPSCYLLWMAMRTYLYKIGNQVEEEDDDDDEDYDDEYDLTECKLLCMSNDRIAIVADGVVEIWSLDTKEHLHTLEPRDFVAEKVLLLDDGLVSFYCMSCHFCFWTETDNGGWSESPWEWGTTNAASVPYEGGLLFMPVKPSGYFIPPSRNRIQEVDYLNLQEGDPLTSKRFGLPERISFPYLLDSVDMLVCNRKWLVIHIRAGVLSELSSKFYVYDLDTNQLTHEFHRDNSASLTCGHIFQSSVGSKTICATGRREPYIFTFDLDDNGRLSERPVQYYVGPVQYGYVGETEPRAVAVFGSHMVVLIDQKCKVYNAETCTHERTWECPEGQHAVVCQARNELLIKSNGVAVKAYCLEEPRL